MHALSSRLVMLVGHNALGVLCHTMLPGQQSAPCITQAGRHGVVQAVASNDCTPSKSHATELLGRCVKRAQAFHICVAAAARHSAAAVLLLRSFLHRLVQLLPEPGLEVRRVRVGILLVVPVRLPQGQLLDIRGGSPVCKNEGRHGEVLNVVTRKF